MNAMDLFYISVHLMGALYVRWSRFNAGLRANCRSKHAKYFVHEGSAAEEEYYGVVWTLCSTSFHRWTGNGYGIDQKSHTFSREITLAIPEKHAWACTVASEKLLT